MCALPTLRLPLVIAAPLGEVREQDCWKPEAHLPNMHEHVGEEAPGASAVSWVIHQRALHVFRVVGLKHPLVETCPVAQEHDDLGTLVLGLVKTRGLRRPRDSMWAGPPGQG